MRRLLTIFTLLGVLTALPAVAMAGGPEPATCPPGLTPERLKATPALVKGLTEATRPLTRHGMVPIPYSVDESEKYHYDYVWGGENTQNNLTSFMICGVKTPAVVYRTHYNYLVVGFLIGFGSTGMLILFLRPRRQ